MSALETDSEEPGGASKATTAKAGDTFAAVSDAAAAERRASGLTASTSQAGVSVEPVAVARCHTLAAEVCCP